MNLIFWLLFSVYVLSLFFLFLEMWLDGEKLVGMSFRTKVIKVIIIFIWPLAYPIFYAILYILCRTMKKKMYQREKKEFEDIVNKIKNNKKG